MAVPIRRQAQTFQTEIYRLNHESVAAFNRGDASTCAGFYAEHATLLLPDQSPIKGRAAIQEFLEGFSALGVKLMPIEPSTILSNGDLGCCAGTYEFHVSAKQGAPVAGAGKFVTVFRREQDGSWKAVIDSFFTDTDTTARTESHHAGGPIGDHDVAENDDRARKDAREIYNKGARYYDPMVWLYYLAGMRIGRWRRKVIEALALRPGDTVVEIGCGTGLNFSLVEEVIGSEGRIIGIDISEAMLERARVRVQRAGWKNVELIRCAAADYRFPADVGGIFATGVLNYEPAYDQVIKRGAKALACGRRWVVLDYKMPKSWLRHLSPLFVFLGSGFGVSRDLMNRHPWRSVERHLRNTRMQELYGGFVYIISGEAP
jgi:demethylmenaquinone methyltransferase/2-methoxy-6-polyprenyl-1,4-benzoquinol methylase